MTTAALLLLLPGWMGGGFLVHPAPSPLPLAWVPAASETEQQLHSSLGPPRPKFHSLNRLPAKEGGSWGAEPEGSITPHWCIHLHRLGQALPRPVALQKPVQGIPTVLP